MMMTMMTMTMFVLNNWLYLNPNRCGKPTICQKIGFMFRFKVFLVFHVILYIIKIFSKSGNISSTRRYAFDFLALYHSQLYAAIK